MTLTQKCLGWGLKFIGSKHKITKIKAEVHLYVNTDQTMETVQEFEEKAACTVQWWSLKDTQTYTEEQS